MSRRTISELVIDTGSRDVDDMVDMALVGHSLLGAITSIQHEGSPYADWAPADGPQEIVVDLFNDLEEANSTIATLSAEVERLTRLYREAIQLADAHRRRAEAAEARVAALEGAIPAIIAQMEATGGWNAIRWKCREIARAALSHIKEG